MIKKYFVINYQTNFFEADAVRKIVFAFKNRFMLLFYTRAQKAMPWSFY
jgi:hypothetical protein